MNEDIKWVLKKLWSNWALIPKARQIFRFISGRIYKIPICCASDYVYEQELFENNIRSARELVFGKNVIDSFINYVPCRFCADKRREIWLHGSPLQIDTFAERIILWPNIL